MTILLKNFESLKDTCPECGSVILPKNIIFHREVGSFITIEMKCCKCKCEESLHYDFDSREYKTD